MPPPLAIAVTSRTATSLGGTNVVTYHNDVARTGQNLNETILTPATVSVSTFGKVGFFPVDGKVDAQPLLLSGVPIAGQGTHNVVYVATEHDSVYAFDADTGAVLWRVSLLGAGETPSDGRSCSQVVPEIGITSTPVIDRARGPNGVIYVVAMSKNGRARTSSGCTRSTSRPAPSCSAGRRPFRRRFRAPAPAARGGT